MEQQVELVLAEFGLRVHAFHPTSLAKISVADRRSQAEAMKDRYCR